MLLTKLNELELKYDLLKVRLNSIEKSIDDIDRFLTCCDNGMLGEDHECCKKEEINHKCHMCGRALQENQVVCSCQIEGEEGSCECDQSKCDSWKNAKCLSVVRPEQGAV